MKSITKIFIKLAAALFIFIGTAGTTQAASMQAQVGTDPNFGHQFPVEALITLNKATEMEPGSNYYQYLVFKTGSSTASIGSFDDICSNDTVKWRGTEGTGSDIILYAWANIDPYDSGLSLKTSSSGNASIVGQHDDSTKPGQYVFRLRSNMYFENKYDNAKLFFVLRSSGLPFLSSPTSGAECDSDTAMIQEIVETKALGSVGNEKPVEITKPEELANKLGVTGSSAKTGGISFAGLFSRFNSGTGAIEGTDFPILGVILKSLLYLAGLFLLLGVVYSGIILIRSTSDDEAAKAKKNLTWLVIGSFLVVMSNWILDTVINFFK